MPLYPPKESSLKELTEWVPLVEWLSLPYFIVLKIFTPPYEASKISPFIPQRRVPFRNDPRGLIG